MFCQGNVLVDFCTIVFFDTLQISRGYICIKSLMSPLFQIPECATAHFSTSDVAYPPFLHSNLQRLCSRDHLSFVPIVFAICEMVEYIWEKNIKS